MKNKYDESIVKPRPIKGFGQMQVLYIPADLPSFMIQRLLQKSAKRIKKTPFGHLYSYKDRIVLAHCIGAPLAVLMLERLIASGAEEIIILGFCGTFEKNTHIGEAVSVKDAISEEGTSAHYFPRKRRFSPSSGLKARVENTLSERELPFFNGTLVSTDAPFRETKHWLDKNREKGVGFVDMETSAVFALAAFYDIEAAALHVVSDQLASSSHRVGFHTLKLEKNVQKYFFPFIDPGM